MKREKYAYVRFEVYHSDSIQWRLAKRTEVSVWCPTFRSLFIRYQVFIWWMLCSYTTLYTKPPSVFRPTISNTNSDYRLIHCAPWGSRWDSMWFSHPGFSSVTVRVAEDCRDVRQKNMVMSPKQQQLTRSDSEQSLLVSLSVCLHFPHLFLLTNTWDLLAVSQKLINYGKCSKQNIVIVYVRLILRPWRRRRCVLP